MSYSHEYEGYDRYSSSRHADPYAYGNGHSREAAYARDQYTSHPPSSYVRGKERRGGDDSYYRQDRGHGPRGGGGDKDDVPHSRLFIVHGSSIDEDELRKSFEKYGVIENIRMVKKRDDKDSVTGIAFVKYSKASEAAKAIDELNGKVLAGSPKPLKVMVATKYGTGKDSVSEEELIRLFIRVPLEFTEDDIREHFGVFGAIEFINMVKDKGTGKPKGLAFVKFFRFYDAARALEEVDPTFRAVFAESRENPHQKGGPRGGARHDSGGGGGGGAGGGGGGFHPGDPSCMGMEYMPNSPAGLLGLLPPDVVNPPHEPEATPSLRLLCAKDIDERNLTFLCEIIPGFRRCDLVSPGVANISFNSLNWAQYAHRKLNGFEYPPGYRIVAKYVADAHGSSKSSDIPFYPVSIELPSKKGLVPKVEGESKRSYKARLFIICSPRALATPILEDAFCRFGSLMEVYTLPGKTIGYAKFDSRQAAEDCRHTLNGAEIAGCRLKVIEAEEERDGSSDAKRRKT